MKSSLWIFCAATVVLSCSAIISRPPATRETAHFGSGQPQCGLQESDLSYTNLVAKIKDPKCRILSIEDLLSILPESFRSNYALMYRSRSLQGPRNTDYLHPRVILFGGDLIHDQGGKPITFLLAFNGKSTDPGFNSIEMIEVDHRPEAGFNGIFNFHEIVFPENTKPLGWAETQNRIEYSGRNPQRCTLCHDSSLRPVWDGYPFWPGAFGSNNFIDIPEEVEGFQQFLSIAPTDPRYRYLAGLGDLLRDGKFIFNHDKGINPTLNLKLARANNRKIARTLLAVPGYAEYRFAILAAGANCSDIPGFLPVSIRAVHDSRIRRELGAVALMREEQIEKEMRAQVVETARLSGFTITPAEARKAVKGFTIKGQNLTYRQLMLDTFRAQGAMKIVSSPTGLRYLIEGRGIPMVNWFMDLQAPAYSYLNGGDPELEFAQAILESDPRGFGDLGREMVKAIRSVNEGNTTATETREMVSACDKLRRASLRALARFPPHSIVVPHQPPEMPTQIRNYPLTFIHTCAACHATGMDRKIPAIPFDNAGALARELSTKPLLGMEILNRIDGNSYYPMPPTRKLSHDEREAIHAYIKKFLR